MAICDINERERLARTQFGLFGIMCLAAYIPACACTCYALPEHNTCIVTLTLLYILHRIFILVLLQPTPYSL